MRNILGRPLGEALSSLSQDEAPPRVVETAAPRREGQPPREGVLRESVLMGREEKESQ